MSQGSDPKYDVILFHGSEDAGVVECLADDLRNVNVTVWLSKWSLTPGESRQQQIATALRGSKTCAVCLGVNPPADWFRQMVELAVERYVQGDFRLIPVMLPGGDRSLLDGFLGSPVEVDFAAGIKDDKAFSLLLTAIRPVEDSCTVISRYRPPEIFQRLREVFADLHDQRKQNWIGDKELIEHKTYAQQMTIKTYLSGYSRRRV